MYISRYDVLGLTAYGKTPKESSDNCTKLMNKFVNIHKKIWYIRRCFNEIESRMEL